MLVEQEPYLLQLKQELFESKILDKNLDQKKFFEYFISQKEKGDDSNNWKFDRLKTCVTCFQESLKLMNIYIII